MVMPSINIPNLIRQDLSGSLRYGKSPKFNFETGEFERTEGQLVITNSQQTLMTWISKALATERGHYRIYNFDFGNDAHELYGHVIPYVRSRIGKVIVESLNDIRIESVSITDVREVDTGLEVDIRIVDRVSGSAIEDTFTLEAQ